jgi:hypothetical protein
VVLLKENRCSRFLEDAHDGHALGAPVTCGTPEDVVGGDAALAVGGTGQWHLRLGIRQARTCT